MKVLKNQNIDFPGTHAVGRDSIALGYGTETTNAYEVAVGINNKSTRAKNPNDVEAISADSDATLFSVGCGTNKEGKNALEVKGDGSTEFMGVGSIQDALKSKVSSTSISAIWCGTEAEYEAITTKDPATLYLTKEEG